MITVKNPFSLKTGSYLRSVEFFAGSLDLAREDYNIQDLTISYSRLGTGYHSGGRVLYSDDTYEYILELDILDLIQFPDGKDYTVVQDEYITDPAFQVFNCKTKEHGWGIILWHEFAHILQCIDKPVVGVTTLPHDAEFQNYFKELIERYW